MWLKIIPNEGTRVYESGVATDKKMVAVPPPLAAHFESGFNIGRIVRSLLERTGKPIPTALNTLREDNTKNTKLTNWNFVWYHSPHAGSPSTTSTCSSMAGSKTSSSRARPHSS